MTEIIHMTSPNAPGTGKDPNDARDDPGYRERLEVTRNQKKEGPNLRAYRASDKKGKIIQSREWIWNDWASAGVVTGLGGPPGVAKSLLAQQLCTHAATGKQYLGDAFLKVPAMHVTCEDDEDELDRRQARICAAMGVALPDNLHLASWIGEESLLVYLENGLFIRTERFSALDEYLGKNGIRFLTLDLIPDFWNGNEIIRTQVNAFVKSHLAYLAQRHKAAIMPLYHPSVRGMADGSGSSGSTAWDGSFRGRIYMERSKDEDLKNPARLIKRVKANYAELDEKEVTWVDGYLQEKIHIGKEDDARKYRVGAFLECLQYCKSKHIDVSPANNSPNYYGKKFPVIWKELDGRHKSIPKNVFEKAFIEAEFDGVITVTEGNYKARPRVEFIGYNAK